MLISGETLYRIEKAAHARNTATSKWGKDYWNRVIQRLIITERRIERLDKIVAEEDLVFYLDQNLADTHET